MDARRADALTDLVLGGTGFCSTGATTAATETTTAAETDGAADTSTPVAPAPSRLPGILPGCGTRTATTNVSIQIRAIVPLDSLRR